jgi:quercetin dioxygenase-like cupin family protein
LRTEPIVVTPSERPKALDLVGEEMTVLQSNAQTGSFEVFLQVATEGSGPPPHHHPWDEAFYVLRGEVGFGSDSGEVSAKTGTLVHIPGGTTHWFKVGVGGAEMLSITSPGGASDFFTAISRDAAGNVPGFQDVIRIAAAHGSTILVPPPG